MVPPPPLRAKVDTHQADHPSQEEGEVDSQLICRSLWFIHSFIHSLIPPSLLTRLITLPREKVKLTVS